MPRARPTSRASPRFMSSPLRISRDWVVSMRTRTSSSPPKLLLHSSNPLNPFLPSRNPLKLLQPSYRPEGIKASSFTYRALTRTAKSVPWPRSTSSASQTMWTPSRRPAVERPLCPAATSPCTP
ncbi:hypothetical protein ACQJBY_061567 [Aegilops geniculata]